MSITGYIGRRVGDGQTMTFIPSLLLDFEEEGWLNGTNRKTERKKYYTEFETHFLENILPVPTLALLLSSFLDVSFVNKNIKSVASSTLHTHSV
jgi:hypothetical protein